MVGAKRGVWWRKAVFLGVKRGVGGIMGVFSGANGVLWGEQVCWG